MAPRTGRSQPAPDKALILYPGPALLVPASPKWIVISV